VTSRREFLQTAAALSAAPLAGGAAFAGGSRNAEHKPLKLDAVVFDARHAESRAFSVRANVLGAPLRVIEGDVTDLWQREFSQRWKQGPVTLAGLTERHALFLFETLAWEYGMRVVFEAEHSPAADGAATHRILRAADHTLIRDLSAAGSEWPRAVADALVAGLAVPSRENGPSGSAMAEHLGEPEKLYSWIIAPRRTGLAS
jgi:hypothetical protein